MEKNRILSDAEIEKELEDMFGIQDGEESEDGLEDSDGEENLLDLLSAKVTSVAPFIEPSFADTLLTNTCSSRRRLGKHGPEQAMDEWEEVEDGGESDEGTNRDISEVRQATDEDITDCVSEQETEETRNMPLDSTSSANTAQPVSSIPRINSVQLAPEEESSLEETDSENDEIDWAKTSWANSPIISSFDDNLQPQNNFSNRAGPLAYFEAFFDQEVFDNILVQTNLFASQSNVRNIVPVTLDELKAYIGMLIQMAIHKLPSIEDYWSSDPILCVPEIAETMTLQRFQRISKCLHVNDNEKMPQRGESGHDKLYKIRPLLDQINHRCQINAKNTKSQTIDESMVKFKGRSALKQYMPLKPVKRGFKIWARADSKTGYLFQFQVYTGKGETVETGLGSSVVKTLAQPLIEEGVPMHLSFDNFFSNYELLQYLYDHGIYSTATARNNRIGMPVLVKKPSAVKNVENIMKRQNIKLKRLQKGEYKWRVRNNVGFVIWKDTKLVTVLSTAFHPKEKGTCRRTQKDGKKKPYPCPRSVLEYSKRMGGVDRFDQQKAAYDVARRSKKWWKRLFYFLVDVAITNAYILYSNNSRVHNPMRQKMFRITLARELVNNLTFRKRKFSVGPKFLAKRKKTRTEIDSHQKKVFGIPEEIRFSNLGEHFPEAISTYRRCRLCSSATNNKRSNIQCDRCEVSLCAIPCFKEFHTNQPSASQ